MTDQILSSLDPFSTASDKEPERALISLTSCLMVSGAVILCAEERACTVRVEKKIDSNKVSVKLSSLIVEGQASRLQRVKLYMYLSKKEDHLQEVWVPVNEEP